MPTEPTESFWRDLLKAIAGGFAQAIGTILAAAIVGAVAGGAAGWWYGGVNLAILGLIVGAAAGVALALVVFYLMNSA